MTSVLNSSAQAAHGLKKPEKSTHSGKLGAAGSDAAGEFASLFGTLMTTLPGQDLAAPAAADGKTTPPSSGLAAEVLGPSVHIITTTEPATSDDSLLAFARAQGMDEDALAMIFGRRPTKETASADALADSLAAQRPTGLGPKLPTGADAALPALPAATADAQSGAAAKGMASVDLGADARLAWSVSPEQPAKPDTKAVAGITMFGLNGIRPMMPQATAAASQAEPDPQPQAAHQSLAASLILGAAEASQFARRLQMKQGAQRAERMADALPAASRFADTGSLAADAEVPVETLDLDTELSGADLSTLLQQRQADGRQPAGDSGQRMESGQPAQQADLDLRAEQYEKLSQRLGEALGQRLAAQIAKGDWKVEMALRPHDLGNVDIELKMNNGGLEASFRASEAATRDLLVDGLPKLKEVLSQLGMEVASVNVNVGQNGQHGGNPTPGKQSAGVAGVGPRRGGTTETPAADTAPARADRVTNDGLDVLA